MRTGKANQEYEDCEEEELVPGKERTSMPNSATDAKNNDKASAIRSKHSVTEQRRRSKINERFQVLRNLMPHSDQKRDTASFLLDRNSHWCVPSFAGQPQTAKNDLGPASSFPVKLEDNTTTIVPSVRISTLNAIDSEHGKDSASKPGERQPELVNKGIPLMMPQQMNMADMGRGDGVLDHSLEGSVCDAQSSASELVNQQEELTIEGGTISISSVYSQGSLEALQSAGLDLTHASISLQINLGKGIFLA